VAAPDLAPAQPPRTEAAPQGATTPQPSAAASRPPAAATPRPQPALPPQPSPPPASVDAGPQRTASIPTRPPAAPETAGGPAAFSVQLAVGATEAEARTLATNLRQRFAGDLGSRSPAVRRAELNGKTLYRVRVESLSRDDANALCSKLRTAGGQCFIAKN
jgi:cell division septation protein DedD